MALLVPEGWQEKPHGSMGPKSVSEKEGSWDPVSGIRGWDQTGRKGRGIAQRQPQEERNPEWTSQKGCFSPWLVWPPP